MNAGKSTLSGDKSFEPSVWQLYRRGIVMNVTNPKIAIFFLAFLPQFTDPAAGPLIPQLLALGGVFILATIIVFGLMAWAAGFLAARLKHSPTVYAALNRIAALVFVILAGRLLAVQR